MRKIPLVDVRVHRRGASWVLFAAACTVAGIAWLAPAPAAAQENPFGSCQKGVPIRARSWKPEAVPDRPNAIRTTLTGSADSPVIIECDETKLQAEQIVYINDTREIHATGNVLLVQPDLRLFAARADMDGNTRFGTFYSAVGVARIGDSATEKDKFGTSESDFIFSGDVVGKTGPRTYEIQNGRFTTCVQPSPRWEMTESTARLTLDKYALLKNVVLRVKNVPVFYLPALYYPINKEGRSTGFLMPTYGSSTIGGTTISNAFFWAMSRWQDLTIYHDWLSKTGQGISTEYRYVRSNDAQGNARFEMLNETFDGDTPGAASSTERSYRLTGTMNQALPHGVRAIGNVNYFTQISSQQLYQSVDDYANRQRSFAATLTGGRGRLQLSATAEQTDYFEGLDQGSRNGRLPSVDLRVADRAIGRSRVYVGGSAQAAYLVRQRNTADPLTDHSLFRFDGGSSIRAPISNLSFLTVTTEASWRLTEWLESLDLDTGQQVHEPLVRQLLQTSATVTGPTFARIFQTPGNGYADRFKHVIEPRFSIRRTSAFKEFDRVVQIDSVDNEVGGVTQIDYGLSNRLLARMAAPPAAPGTPARPGRVREILTVGLSQSYYSDALAAIYDPEYQTASGTAAQSKFSPLRLDATFKPTDDASTRFRMSIDPTYRTIQSVSATARIDTQLAQISADWYRQFVIPQRPNFSEALASQFLNANVTVRTRNNHFGGTYGVNYDLKKREFVNQRITGYYNTQCCGLNFDYQTRSTPLLIDRGVPSNHQFAVSFSLAGIGAFSNPLGSFGGR